MPYSEGRGRGKQFCKKKTIVKVKMYRMQNVQKAAICHVF